MVSVTQLNFQYSQYHLCCDNNYAFVKSIWTTNRVSLKLTVSFFMHDNDITNVTHIKVVNQLSIHVIDRWEATIMTAAKLRSLKQSCVMRKNTCKQVI